GEIRLASKKALIESIKEGVRNGLFGLGYVSGNEIKCKYINEIPIINLTDEEIIIRSEECVKDIEGEVEGSPPRGTEEIPPIGEIGRGPEEVGKKKYSKLSLRLKVPVGQISTIARIVNYLKNKFNQCSIEVTIHAGNGEIQVTEYEDKVLEALSQAGIKIEEEIYE
ncbi:MAG: AAA family ATPase, partial [Synergistetes bacterium]|nr:AAA family ATPase [Synergistota bacterium]